MKILCLDYGTKQTGVAISDSKLKTALPLTTISARKHHLLIKELTKIVSDYHVGKIVCGLPLTVDNQVSEMGKQIEEFSSQLAKALSIPVVMWNENHTSQLAAQNFDAKDPRIHAEAARIMLQEYLDNNLINNEQD